jgi:hypothetical protein
MNEHSVAKAWLKKVGNTILINDINFFENGADELEDKFNLKPIIPFINIGEQFSDEEDNKEDEITEISYDELKSKYGYVVYSVPAY